MKKVLIKKNSMDSAIHVLQALSDEQLQAIQFMMPWQQGAEETSETATKDADGFPITGSKDTSLDNMTDRETIQALLWNKFHTNPHVGTAVRGTIGRLAGYGFEVSSEIFEINEQIEDNEYDPRNRLYTFWPKYVARAIIEGELFLCLTVHDNGFIETDFLDPSNIAGGGEDGIIYHPDKATLPLFYFVTSDGANVAKRAGQNARLIPSIFVAYYPELAKVAKEVDGYSEEKVKDSVKTNGKFKELGFQRFIVSWDRSFVTRRNISSLRTILVWLNHYENLKKYEIDHKKSAGAYLWVVTMEDPKAFRLWLSLSDEDRRKTGVMAKKTPGGTLVLPPGMKIEAINPKLPTISEGDTDILHMVTGGLNEPEDVSTGQSKGTFASVKASRGPMSDRISDEVSYFERFLKFDYYRAIFFLKNKVAGFPDTFKIKTAVDYDGSKKPIFKNVKKRPEFLIDVTFPTSEVIDAESRARAYLGVKHGSLYDTMGIPNRELAKKLGFGNYAKMRLAYEGEKDRYPELLPPVDAGGGQLDQDGLKKKKGIAKPNNKKNQE